MNAGSVTTDMKRCPVSIVLRRIVTIVTMMVSVGSFAAIVATPLVAQRVVAALIPNSQDNDFAHDLVRNLGIA